jgi:hypothetical protein
VLFHLADDDRHALYGPELLLTKVLRESPTTELMLARRPV